MPCKKQYCRSKEWSATRPNQYRKERHSTFITCFLNSISNFTALDINLPSFPTSILPRQELHLDLSVAPATNECCSWELSDLWQNYETLEVVVLYQLAMHHLQNNIIIVCHPPKGKKICCSLPSSRILDLSI